MTRDILIDHFFASTQTMQRAWKSHFFKIADETQVPPAQLGLLFLLRHKQPINGRDIASEMHISKSAVTQLIDAVDQLGYIERQADETDRRIVRISLSKKGEAQVAILEEKRTELLKRLASTLDDNELEAIIAINAKMITELEK